MAFSLCFLCVFAVYFTEFFYYFFLFSFADNDISHYFLDNFNTTRYSVQQLHDNITIATSYLVSLVYLTNILQHILAQFVKEIAIFFFLILKYATAGPLLKIKALIHLVIFGSCHFHCITFIYMYILVFLHLVIFGSNLTIVFPIFYMVSDAIFRVFVPLFLFLCATASSSSSFSVKCSFNIAITSLSEPEQNRRGET